METETRPTRWRRVARIRRLLITTLILYTTVIASSYMADVLPGMGSTRLELAIVVVFGALFAWVSIGFWEAMGGLLTLWRGRDPLAISAAAAESPGRIGEDCRTAVVMPICNEEVGRVFAGLRATYRSLQKTGQIERFHFFVLSDTGDPDTWVAEEIAWAGLCRDVGGFNRVFYRHRTSNYKRKSGNIADFCRRWGRSYRYMVVLDADSVMQGETIVRLVQIMERSPNVGIVQTAPLPVNRESLIARVQQFASHVYGPAFNAGLHFLQLGDSHSWGHNMIVRIEPFMEHCGLPRLPGKPPLGGHILSHDFVEAALMRKAGWEVWLAHELTGSYEEIPSSLINELKRDRRWSQGNLQHLRLLFTGGLFPAHRALFLHGVMSYGSALLWFLFLCLSSAKAVAEAFQTPDYFPAGRALFPEWPLWHPRWALTLLAATAVLLFLPKVLSVLTLILRQRKAQRFGGVFRLLLSTMLEAIFSALFAPSRMAYHCKCFVLPLLGREVGWSGQQRGDRETRWRDALRFHAGTMVVAFLWAAALFVYNRSFFWWISPVSFPLILAVPLSVWFSRVAPGKVFRRAGLFLVPEERNPPDELRDLNWGTGTPEGLDYQLPAAWRQGFIRAVVDPSVNALHRFLVESTRRPSGSAQRLNQGILEKALSSGPGSLSDKEKKRLLRDPRTLLQLHRELWDRSEGKAAHGWGLP
jgi:membrane glycosyltransferase